LTEYKEGQVWNYKTRVNELESKLIILKVEEYETLGEVIHIYVTGLAMIDNSNPSEVMDDISHMPFSKEAIDDSVISFDDMTEIPDYSEGYEIWKESFMKGDAGVFSVLVSEAVEFMEKTINEGEL